MGADDSVAAQIKVCSNHVPSSSPLQAAGLLVSASLLPSAALRAWGVQAVANGFG